MSTWGKLSATVKHVAKHRTSAKLTVDDTELSAESSNAFETRAREFNVYIERVKVLSTHTEEMKKQFLDTFGKAGRIGQNLVELTEQGAGQAALRANRIRTVIARIQATIVRKMVPDLENVFIPSLTEQLVASRDLKSRIEKRLELVTDANHYTAKYNAMVTEGCDDLEKVARNKGKCEGAVKKLEVETKAILDALDKVSRDKRQLCIETCGWLRSLLRVFFSEAVKAHDSNSDTSSHELSIESSGDAKSIGSKVAGAGKSARHVGAVVGASFQHAVKHKGGGILLRAEDTVTVTDNFNEYEVANARFKRSAKVMTAMKASMEVYQQAVTVLVASITTVVDDFMKIADNSTELSYIPSGLQQGWLIASSSITSQLIDSLANESLEPLELQLEAIAQVESVSAERRKHQLDVNYYATKMKGLKDKAEKSTVPMDAAFVERQSRNQKKYELAVGEFEQTTSSALSLFRAFETTGDVLIANLMESYDRLQRLSFESSSVSLYSDSFSSRDKGSSSSMDNQLVPSASQQNMLQAAADEVPPSPPTDVESRRHTAPEVSSEALDVESNPHRSLESLRRRSDIASVPRKGLVDAKKGMIPLLPGEIGEDDEDDEEEVEQFEQFNEMKPVLLGSSTTEGGGTPPRLSGTLMVASTPTDSELEESMISSPAASASPHISVVAVFDFPGVESGDLPFMEGDVFQADAAEFETQAEGGWVTGWHNGQVGMFPSNYVQKTE